MRFLSVVALLAITSATVIVAQDGDAAAAAVDAAVDSTPEIIPETAAVVDVEPEVEMEAEPEVKPEVEMQAEPEMEMEAQIEEVPEHEAEPVAEEVVQDETVPETQADVVEEEIVVPEVEEEETPPAAVVVECDCAPEIESQRLQLVSERDALAASIATATELLQSLGTKIYDCTVALEIPKVSSHAALEELKRNVAQYEQSLSDKISELKEEIRETNVATKMFREREEEKRVDLTALFKEYKERKEELEKYTLEHKEKTEVIYKETIAEMAKPAPMVNTAKIVEDAKKLFQSLLGPKKEEAAPGAPEEAESK